MKSLLDKSKNIEVRKFDDPTFQVWQNRTESLLEMGATWIRANEHIPILIPPLKYEEIKGVIPLTQGFRSNESVKLNSFKNKIEKLFDLKPIQEASWERKR